MVEFSFVSDMKDVVMGKNNNLTVIEKRAIKTLNDLAKNWPKSLWIFATGSSDSALYVMKYSLSEDGSGMRHDLRSPSVDPNGIVASIKIPCDGGDW